MVPRPEESVLTCDTFTTTGDAGDSKVLEAESR